MSEAWDEAELEGALRLDATGADTFINPRLSLNMNHKLFGGQYIANALTAAMMTAPARRPQSLQGIFLRPGHAGEPLHFEVERVHDGARLSHRRVRMLQAGRVIFLAQVYLSEGLAGVEAGHQSAPRADTPAPESLAEMQELGALYQASMDPLMHQRMVMKKAVLVKPLHPEAALITRSAEPRLALWLKSANAISGDPLMQYAALAFFSDFWLCWPVRSPHIETLLDPSKPTFSLDHSMWFHAPACVDDWLLYEVDSPFAGEGLGLGRGAFYDRSGRLIASTAQQAMLA